MNILEQKLGRIYTAIEVAKIFGMSVASVRTHYRVLGGIRIGSAYRFFERGLIDAISQQDKNEMGGSGKKTGEKDTEVVSSEKRSQSMGSRDKKRNTKRVQDKKENRHNLLV